MSTREPGRFAPKYLDHALVCEICAEIHPKDLPKGRNLTYLEDPGIGDEILLSYVPGLENRYFMTFSHPGT